MINRLLTPPAQLPVTLEEVKEHLRIDDTDHDSLITTFINAAVADVENMTGRALITQTWDLLFDSWGEIKLSVLPFGNLQSITSIKYYGEDDTEQLVSTDNYIVANVGTDFGRIWFDDDSDFDYPVLGQATKIIVTGVFGYGDTDADIPAIIKTSIKLIVSDLFDSEDTSKVVTAFLNQYRLFQ